MEKSLTLIYASLNPMQICSALWSCTSASRHLTGEAVLNNLLHMCDMLELQNGGNVPLGHCGAYCSFWAGFANMMMDKG